MTIENALPIADVSAGAGEQQHDAGAGTNNELENAGEGGTEGEGTEAGAKPPKTAEQREIERLRRAVDRRTRQLYEARGQAGTQQVAETRTPQAGTTPPSQANDEKLTLSRSELDKLIKDGAEKLAPAIRQQQTEIEQRAKVVEGLAKEWGKEKFDTFASDLDDVFGGLADQKGQPKAATNAIFESEMPAALIEYLTDPDNADEAEALSHMGDRQAGRAVAKIEAKLTEAKKTGKPQRSNAPAPLETIKGGGKSNSMPDPGNTKAYIAWANKQDRGQ